MHIILLFCCGQKVKNGKATGPDGIPVEVWKNSLLAKEELFFFVRGLWQSEAVPKKFALCAFVMLYKKGSKNMCANYRALGLLNHSYKILSICLLNRLVKETSWFLSDWQAGFREGRGCRDNILLLRVIYDQIIRGDDKCVVTFIDFEAAFDSVSHKQVYRQCACKCRCIQENPRYFQSYIQGRTRCSSHTKCGWQSIPIENL